MHLQSASNQLSIDGAAEAPCYPSNENITIVQSLLNLIRPPIPNVLAPRESRAFFRLLFVSD